MTMERFIKHVFIDYMTVSMSIVLSSGPNFLVPFIFFVSSISQ